MTEDGRTTAERRLLRADNLQGLSERDVARLVGEFGVTRVIDLRTIEEVTSEGPGPLRAVESVEHVHRSVILVGEDVAREALVARRERFAAANPDDVLASHYYGYLEDRPDSVVAALRDVAHSPGAALVHCAAGKDRTGVIVALALLTVGVPRHVVVADYVATASRIEQILARLRASHTYADGVDEITTEEHTPRAAVMEGFLSLVDSRFGGVEAWLASQDFGRDDVSSLRRRLLA
jgi:protein tyrosine/serine phosphatase